MHNCPRRSWMPETRLLRGHLSILMTTLILCAGVQAVPSAESSPIAPNSLVRVHLKEPAIGTITHPNLIQGRLLDSTATDISLASDDDKPPTVLPLDNVERLDLNTRQGRHGRGALIGAASGVALLSLYVLTRHDDDSSDVEGEWQILSDEAGFALFGTMAALLGALVGALVAPDAKWQSIPPDQIRLGRALAPPGETRLAVTLRF
mgnify:CR=1 FL=1